MTPIYFKLTTSEDVVAMISADELTAIELGVSPFVTLYNPMKISYSNNSELGFVALMFQTYNNATGRDHIKFPTKHIVYYSDVKEKVVEFYQEYIKNKDQYITEEAPTDLSETIKALLESKSKGITIN